jgi:hypothetical protein
VVGRGGDRAASGVGEAWHAQADGGAAAGGDLVHLGELVLGAGAARTRIKGLIPEGASVFTGASETLRLSGIEEDINNSGRYDALKSRGTTMDRATQETRSGG